MTKKFTTEIFISRARLIHGDTFLYDRSEYTTSRNKVTITCRVHGDFEQNAMNHLRGDGCRKCSREDRRLNTELFIMRSREIHGDKFDYERTRFITSRDNVIITCRKHGDFEQKANNHLNGNGCMECANDARRMTTEDFISAAKDIHGDTYLYDKTEYVSSHEKVTITCRTHGDFDQTAYHHLLGVRCAKCARDSFVSAQETEWLDSLNNDNIIRQYVIEDSTNLFVVDGYDPTTKTVYEYNGDYWHGNPSLYDRDTLNMNSGKTMGELLDNTLSREQALRDLGYNLVVMWESDWRKMRKQLLDVNQTV